MTNSIDKNTAKQLIDEITDLLDEEYLYHNIDKPIYIAASTFETEFSNFDFKTFIQLTGHFINHLYSKGIHSAAIFFKLNAYLEMEAILSQLYPEDPDEAISYAYLDALTDKTGGIDLIFSQITDVIILKHRNYHTRWVYVKFIESKSWHDRCMIADFLLTNWEKYWSEDLLQCVPARLARADIIIKMIEKIIGANQKAYHPSSNDIF